MIGCGVGKKEERGVLPMSVKKSVMALGRLSVPVGMRGGRKTRKHTRRQKKQKK
jgi:hypothetical protein